MTEQLTSEDRARLDRIRSDADLSYKDEALLLKLLRIHDEQRDALERVRDIVKYAPTYKDMAVALVDALTEPTPAQTLSAKTCHKCGVTTTFDARGFNHDPDCPEVGGTAPAQTANPVPMQLDCPKCGLHHVDTLDAMTGIDWATRPHKTHLCLGCGHLFKPAEYTTVGMPAPAQTAEPEWITDVFPEPASTHTAKPLELRDFPMSDPAPAQTAEQAEQAAIAEGKAKLRELRMQERATQQLSGEFVRLQGLLDAANARIEGLTEKCYSAARQLLAADARIADLERMLAGHERMTVALSREEQSHLATLAELEAANAKVAELEQQGASMARECARERGRAIMASETLETCEEERDAANARIAEYAEELAIRVQEVNAANARADAAEKRALELEAELHSDATLYASNRLELWNQAKEANARADAAERGFDNALKALEGKDDLELRATAAEDRADAAEKHAEIMSEGHATLHARIAKLQDDLHGHYDRQAALAAANARVSELCEERDAAEDRIQRAVEELHDGNAEELADEDGRYLYRRILAALKVLRGK